MRFGPCGSAHIQVHSGANLSMSSYGTSGPNAFKQVDGNAAAHILVSQGSSHTMDAAGGPNLSILNAISVGAWASVNTQGLSQHEYYQSMSGQGNVSGSKFNISGLSLLNLAGRGVNYLPGNSAGVAATGAVVA